MRIRNVDVGRIRGGGRSRYFINGMGLGFNSAVTLESRSIRRLQGMMLYGLAFLRALWRHYECPELSIRLDDQVFDQETLALTVNLGKREGGFLVTPHADLSDGLFDVVLAGAIPRLRAVWLLPKLAAGTLPRDHPLIRQTRCRHAQFARPNRCAFTSTGNSSVIGRTTSRISKSRCCRAGCQCWFPNADCHFWKRCGTKRLVFCVIGEVSSRMPSPQA